MTRVLSDVREMLSEQVEYRELLYRLAARDITVRYKQTIMGFGWAVFMPVVNTIVFSVIFTRVAPIETPVAYPLYAYCGLSAWNLFASSLRFSVIALTGNQGLVTKVYFPREIFPFSSIAVCVIDYAVSTILLVALMIYYGVMPTASILLLPVVLTVQIAFTCAIGLTLAMANLFYRDVKYLVELVITVWMFLTSVLYPVELMGGRLAAIIRFNPMTPIIDGYRTAFFGLPMNDPLGFVVASIVSVVLLLWAWVAFHRAEYTFAENL